MKSVKTRLQQETALTVLNEKTDSIGMQRVLIRPVGLISQAWKWFKQQQVSRSNVHRLKLENSISLGQKRFAAVIEVQGMRFLVGGGASNVELLARLDNDAFFANVLDRTKAKSRSRGAATGKKKTVKKNSEKADQQA